MIIPQWGPERAEMKEKDRDPFYGTHCSATPPRDVSRFFTATPISFYKALLFAARRAESDRMGPTMNTHALYVNFTDTVILACDACHRSTTLPAATVKDLPQPLKVRCPCGAVFGVTVVIRSCYRKPTRLPGTYGTRDAQTGQLRTRGQMIVENLSRTGLGFRPLTPDRPPR